ncbi:MAG: beta-galactosidase trimerization domain-containing protein [Clostridia bacterium]
MELNFRQIHLDFHTSELIGGVGGEFDPREFARTLKDAHVGSVTCFARCHHGMMYYTSEKFPERIHPGLGHRNLLKEQIDACHALGIRVPVYITVQWDYYTSVRHPEWLMRNEDGSPVFQHSLKPGFYHGLCVNTPYAAFLAEHTREVLETLDADGIFFDIVQEKPCACEYCISSMREKGYNPLSAEDRTRHYEGVLAVFRKNMTTLVEEVRPGILVFYNSGHISYKTRKAMDPYTHFELESLPGGEWGYIHFPVVMRYARNLGKDCLAHTGKFHTTWGDFHSFKNREALEYECFRMLALNAKCLIGDQLEPGGKLSGPVYSLIGGVYGQVEKKEAWCKNAKPVTEIGVFTPDEFQGSGLDHLPEAQIGAARILEQCACQFDFIDTDMDFSRYKLLVMPDRITVDEAFHRKLKAYLEEGGKILASYESGMDAAKESFTLSELQVEISGETLDDSGLPVKGKPYQNNDFADYVVPAGPIGKGLCETDHVMYIKGMEVRATGSGVGVLDANSSLFNRSYKHFCSHNQAPSSGKKAYDAAVMTRNTIYFAHPVFLTYHHKSPKWVKVLVKNAIGMLLPGQLVEHDGPSTLLTALNEQEGRYVLHLLHYIPERKSEKLDIIEDVIPLYDLKVRLRLPGNAKTLRMVPEGEDMVFTRDGDGIVFTIPRMEGHCMLEINC